MNITDDIKYVGVDDHIIDLFEGQYVVPNGMAYNSYVIMDEKIAVTDTVCLEFKDEWLDKLAKTLGERKPNYLIIHHMEPDHSGNVMNFLEKYPDTTVVGNAQTFNLLNNFFEVAPTLNKLVVKEGDVLDLGKHKLQFIFAPMVHWPEVMMSYDQTDKVLFTADAFGKFGANDIEDPEGWACEARRYYFGIVGKFGQQVQALLKKLEGIQVDTICSLHGPVLNDNIGYYVDLYNKWSAYLPEDKGITVAYASVYGHTEKAVLELKEMLEANGAEEVSLFDLSRDDMAEAVEDAFRYDRLVLACPTYCGDIFPVMRTFIEALTERNYQNRTIGFIENGSWGPVAAKVMKSMFENSKDITYVEPTVTIKAALKEDSRTSLKQLADALTK